MAIVVVHELQSSLDFLAERLGDQKQQVFGFTDSAAALKFITETENVSIVLIGLHVAPLNGIELCWALRSQISAPRFVHIVAISSNKDGSALGEALDSGADDFLTTPITTEELRARMRAARRLIELQKTLAHEARTDPLTGLSNRRGLACALEALSRNTFGTTTIAIFDIDYFKKVNDTFGHDIGDMVIRKLAGFVAKEDYIVARIGGEEFAIAMPGIIMAEAFYKMERLRTQISQLQFEADKSPFQVTCSFGATIWHHNHSFEDALKIADIALYKAKANGRNRVEFQMDRRKLTAEDALGAVSEYPAPV